jgi:cleavage and polyadenylation specificity factor subunit 4
VPSQACSPCRLPTLHNWLLPTRTRLPSRPVRVIDTYLSSSTNLLFRSPKPNLPSPKSYEPPSPPSNRDLGPPPPGYGRYADFDRGGAMGPQVMPHGGPNGSGPPRRNLDDVLCFKVCLHSSLFQEKYTHHTKCGEKGHYANHCRNRNVPGNRGGLDRSKRFGGTDD